MDVLTIDFETYWDSKEYTLSKMTTEEYVRDPRFHAHGACLHVLGDPEPAVWVTGKRLADAFAAIDWDNTTVLAHNAQFDVTILSWVFGVRPKRILDTLSMARALRGVEVGNSLDKLATAFGLPGKGKALLSTDGVRVLDAQTERGLAGYCVHDVWLCEQIFERLFGQGYPSKELSLIDMTVRMYTEPTLLLDADLLEQGIAHEKTHREALLQRLGVDDATLASNEQFAGLLHNMGVSVPYKTSKTTGKQALALAKTDAAFQQLLASDNEDVAALCEARLLVKSTTVRTRAQRFLDISQRGALPVPLSYYGALSGRWTASKGSAINMQNLKRGSFLRRAIMAPEGHVLVVGDLAQIEPRVLAWLCDYQDLLDVFRSGADPYAAFGAQMFGIPDMTKETHPDLRQSAKSAMLGCGYQLGWASFAAQVLTGFLGAPPMLYEKPFAKKLGVTAEYVGAFVGYEPNVIRMQDMPHVCTDTQLITHCVAAKKIIDIYRSTAHPVASFWGLCSELIERSLYAGHEYTHKCLVFRKEEVLLPNGMSIRYPNLHYAKGTEGSFGAWVYGEEGNLVSLYGGKLTNNITQALARIVMTDGMLRVAKRYPVKSTVHDELVCVAPQEQAAQALPWVLAQMTEDVPFMPGLPLDASGGWHRRYGDAKQ